MSDTFEMIRTLNQGLGMLAFGLIMWRITSSWDHAALVPRWFYRTLTVLLAVSVLLIALTAVQYDQAGAKAGPVSPANSLLLLASIGLALWWPIKHKDRRADR